MELSIVIVHYKTLELTRRCIASINDTVRCSYEVIVVDNDSQDGAKALIIQEFPSVKWIENNKNEGFGRANNTGAKYAMGKVLLFMNSDMIVPENCIDICVDAVINDSTIGVYSCKILNEDLSVQRSLFYAVDAYKDVLKTNILLDKFVPFKKERIEAVLGAFMFIPKDLFLKLDGFDPDFFMYSEELDLCKRIRNAGFRIAYTDTIHAIHKHGGSTSDSSWSLRQKSASNLLLQRKTKGVFGYLFYPIVQFLNALSNLVFLPFMGADYRRDYFKQQLLTMRSLRYFMRVLLFYKRKPSKQYLKVQ